MQQGSVLFIYTAILHMSLHPVIGFSNFFVAMDQLLAISYPVQYRMSLKKKIVTTSAIICSAVWIIFILLYSLAGKPRIPATVTTINIFKTENWHQVRSDFMYRIKTLSKKQGIERDTNITVSM
ncbi:hypothetical protein QR680_015493 [Steinernema hermaphroditum]|uniref:Uncharacterized protein n=1 Tax=Steinernema hermaphroditum TaxID=289476 RepID=A0AA39LKP5_9BILA|nr:hypothetical protein QR680_015493 [Steinernema hermaphroditum]